MPQISTEVLSVLSASMIQGNTLRLQGQIDRKLYVETDKVLQAAGGKWNRSVKAHVFDGDAAEVLEPLILTGEYQRTKQDFGQFDTPAALADRAVSMAEISAEMKVYEPSCGVGNIVAAIVRHVGTGANVFGNEIDPKRHAECVARCYGAFGAGGITNRDFLAIDPAPTFDRIVMNPPFAKQADIEHVRHAFGFLAPGGILVSIMSAGTRFRQDRKATAFREFVEANGGEFFEVEPGAFQSSGTMVNTCIVKISK